MHNDPSQNYKQDLYDILWVKFAMKSNKIFEIASKQCPPKYII